MCLRSLLEGDVDVPCSNGANSSKPFVSDIINFCVSTVAMVSCLLVVTALFHYKLHCSFNYRLLIYCLIANTLMSFVHVVALPVAWYGPGMDHFCQSLAALGTYSLWVLIISSFFIAVEVVSMAVCYVQLKILEIPLVLTSLLLPVAFFWIPLVTDNYGYTSYGCWIREKDVHCNRSHTGHVERLAMWYIPLLVLLLLVCVMFVMVILTLTLHSCKEKKLLSSGERESLLSSHSNYYMALKEIVTLFGCPVIVLLFIVIVEVVVVFLVPNDDQFWLKVLFSATPGIFSFVTAVSLGIHLLVLGKKRKAALGKSVWCWTRKTSIHLVTSCINEGAEYTAAGSITVSHPTEFEPHFESESFQ